jgi:hypothetical protein
MKAALFLLFLAAVSSMAVQSDKETIIYDTVSPNTFWFSSSEYVVTENETNLVVTVEWSSGNRGYSGWVDYVATNGTASAGSDYEGVSGRLYFSSPAARTFSIPVHADSIVEGEETIQLFLSNPTAIIQQSNAVVKIEDNFTFPPIEISRGQDGMIMISWPGQTSDFVLESSSVPSGDWSQVSTPPSLISGQCRVSQAANSALGFFRLRRNMP